LSSEKKAEPERGDDEVPRFASHAVGKPPARGRTANMPKNVADVIKLIV